MPYGGGYGMGGGYVGGSVGGSAAAGISAGFQMGRQVDQDAERRTQMARENSRQDMLDSQRADQLKRENAREDAREQDTQNQHALADINGEMEDNRFQMANLASKYGGAANVPDSMMRPFIDQAKDIAGRRSTLQNQIYAPIVQREQQWAQNISSRIQAGQMSMDDLSPADTVRLMQATAHRPVTDFLRPDTSNPAIASDVGNGVMSGNSIIGQGIADTEAGVQSGNAGLTAQGASTLTAPEVSQGVGHIAADGSQITGKTISALVPAPQAPNAVPPAPPGGVVGALGAALNGTTPATSYPVSPTGAPAPGGLTGAAADASTPPAPADNGMGGAPDTPVGATAGSGPAAPAAAATRASPVPAQAAAPSGGVTGTAPAPPPPPPLVQGTDPDRVIPVLNVTTQHPDGSTGSYHAPMTVNRSTDPNDPIHPGINISDAMNHMGQLGTLEAWANTPAARAKIAQGQKDLGPNISDFTSAYAAMHGDPNALQPKGAADPTSVKIAAVKTFMNDYNVQHPSAPITFADAMQQVEGKSERPATGLAGRLADLHDAAVKDGISDKDEATKMQGLGLLPTPASASGTTGLGDAANLSGPALLATLNPNDQATVKGLLDGTVKPETISIRNNHRQNMVAIASRVGPMNTNTAQVSTRTELAFTVGAESKSVRAFNTAINHLDTLGPLATALNNGDNQSANKIKNNIANWSGDADVSNFNGVKRLVADEVVKAIVGSATQALGDREAAEKTILAAQSPAQLSGIMANYQKLMGGQLTSLGLQYQSGGGKKPFATTFLTPAARKFYVAPEGSGGGGVSGGGGGAPVVHSDADYAALAPGTAFVDAQGKPWTKPKAPGAASASAIPTK
jgi:hypothetical protein